MQQPEIQTYPSTIDDIQVKLNRLMDSMRAAGLEVDGVFNPGLSREEIRQKTEHLPFPIPEELYQLYTWRNGTPTDTDLFMFRDHYFISLEQAIEEYKHVEHYYHVVNALPFATCQSSWLVLPSIAYKVDAELWPPASEQLKLERPVISVFQGIDIFAYSLSILLDTVIEWFDQGVAVWLDLVPAPYRDDLEMRIWIKHNPGIFQTPEYVYTPGPDFQQQVVARASKYITQVGEPIILYGTRTTGPVVLKKLDDIPIGTCWWRKPPPEFEREVAGNLGWEVTPSGFARFDAGTRREPGRAVTFSQPGIYQLKGHSIVWCHPGCWSNVLEIQVLASEASEDKP